MTSDVHHIAIFVRDMDRALHLFEDLLGFALTWRKSQIDVSKLSAMLGSSTAEAELAYLQGRPDGAAIELICPSQAVIDNDVIPYGGSGSGHLSLVVEDLDGLCQSLNEEGWPLLTPIMPITTPGGDPERICFFRTEDGLTIELVAS
jgi:catechol 2,3-dioxygenase-like lactoylglutathione lyase family enzyme